MQTIDGRDLCNTSCHKPICHDTVYAIALWTWTSNEGGTMPQARSQSSCVSTYVANGRRALPARVRSFAARLSWYDRLAAQRRRRLHHGSDDQCAGRAQNAWLSRTRE